MKYSTGRKTRVKYSTAMSWDEYDKKVRRSRSGTPLEGGEL